MKVDRNTYLGMAALGLILPYSQFVPFLIENGLDISLILGEITSSRIATFGWLDVVVSAVVLVIMITEEKDKLSNWWIPVIATFTVGVSCGLPLYMYFHE